MWRIQSQTLKVSLIQQKVLKKIPNLNIFLQCLIMSVQSGIKEINFKSNVERAVYEVFNRVCEGLGYDWREYTSDEKYYSPFFTIIQTTYIDGYPEKRKDFILRREVRKFGEAYCKIGIITPKGKEFTEYDIRKMLIGNSFYSNEEQISDKKIDEVAREILKEFE